MMGDVYVLNKNLELIGVVDGYKSCIWANRYVELGDCEIYTQATVDNFKLFEIGNYIVRMDDEMVCQIRKVELDTSVEEGNYIIVTGIDTKCILDQRIIWGMSTCKSKVEEFVRGLVTDAFISPTIMPEKRRMLKENGTQLLYLGDLSQFNEVVTEQVSYANIGEKIREYCKQFHWGYRVVLHDTSLYFELYKGEDKSDWVVFSPDYENIDTTKYVNDNTNMGNVALIAGSGEGSERAIEVIGQTESTDRFEIYVDARDLNRRVKYSDLVSAYPGGTVIDTGSAYYYRMSVLDVQIYTDEQLAELQTTYPNGQIKIINEIKYYEVYNVNVAIVYSATPSDNDDATLLDVVYDVYLLNRGTEKLSDYGTKVSFEGVVEPNVTFEYKKDYFLGDVVTVHNEYGITLEARITEIVEVNDDNGYSVEPKFEYIV